MNDKPFIIYQSSAGSGKTRTLAKEYLKLALANGPEYFKYILAVTFTRKATQEMKGRIIHYLQALSSGNDTLMAAEIADETGISIEDVSRRADTVLSRILHNYSGFSVGTIDAFFQRVIRAFTREMGLSDGFQLEVDHDSVLIDAVDQLVDELGTNAQLTGWVLDFAQQRLSAGEHWNVTNSLLTLSKELFKDEFKLIESEVTSLTTHPDFYSQALTDLHGRIRLFKGEMKAVAGQAVTLIKAHGLVAEDFSYGDQGTAFKYFFCWHQEKQMEARARVLQCLESVDKWVNKKSARATVVKDIAPTLMEYLNQMISIDRGSGHVFRGCQTVLRNFYAFGLLSEINNRMSSIKRDRNLFLLSDGASFLNEMIADADTPFIYERSGSFIKNYLIDEFQDTAVLQWRNFSPLIRDAGDQGNNCVIVGDIKQSIYRWRGGDLSLLKDNVETELGKDRVTKQTLEKNFRSAGNIVRFNNKVFSEASLIVSKNLGSSLPSDVFITAEQMSVKFKDDGFVNVEFIDTSSESELLTRIPGWLEKLQDQGIRLSDVAILVRTNKECGQIAKYLLDFAASADSAASYRYDVFSSESLLVESSLAIRSLLAAFEWIVSPTDKLATANLAGCLNTGLTPEEIYTLVSVDEVDKVLPKELVTNRVKLLQNSIVDTSERLIRILNLGQQAGSLLYLATFQDIILNFENREHGDIAAFLEWWSINREKQFVQGAATVDAVSVMTIHKAKGLQFKYVLIPFCDWSLDHDHGPFIWVRSSSEPFNTMGPLVVRYSAALQDTCFDNEYRAERTRAYVDSLNTLYVAMTRAEHGLFILVPKRGKGKELTTVGHLLEEVLSEYTGGDIYISGELKQLSVAEKTDGHIPLALSGYQSSDWSGRVAIRNDDENYFASLRNPAPDETVQ